MKLNYFLSAVVLCLFFSINTNAQKKKRHYAYINTKGEVVIDTDYKWADDFHNGRAQFKKTVVMGNKAYYNYGFIDKTGKEVIPAIYEKVYEFKTDVTWVKKRGEDKFILIDLNGNRVGNTSWDAVGFWFEDMCQVKVAWDDPNRYSGTSYKEGFVNKKGEVVIDPKDGYFGSGFYNEGVVCLTQEDKPGYGFLDKEGKVVIPLMYKQAGSSSFYGGLARVKSNGRTGLINKNNEWVVKPKYGTVSGFGDSLLTVAFGSSYNNFGFVNFNNEVVIKGQFDGAESFKAGFARVDKDGKYGVINKKGEIVIPMEHYAIYNEMEESGYFKALNDRKFTYFDKTGKQITEIEAKSKAGYAHGIFPVRDAEGNVQYYNNEGKLVSNAKFCNGKDHSDEGLALVQLCDDVNYAKGRLIDPNSVQDEGPVEDIRPDREVIKPSWKVHTNIAFKTSFITPGEIKEEKSIGSKGLPKTKMQSLTDDFLVKVTVDQLTYKIKKSKKEASLEKACQSIASTMAGKVVKQPETFTISGETAKKQVFVRGDKYYLYVVSSKGDLLYQWVFVAKKNAFDSKNQDFLNSLKIL